MICCSDIVLSVMSPVDDRATQAMIYAAAVAVPLMAGSFGDAIPAIGGIECDSIVNLTIAIQDTRWLP